MLGCVLLGALASASRAEPVSGPPAAEMKVHGLGWWQDREMQENLALLLHDQLSFTYGPNAIEDGALLILSQLTSEGRLHPRLEITATPPDHAPVVWLYDAESSPVLPPAFAARTVEYRIEPGVRYRVANVEIEGLQALSPSQGLAFFQDRSAFAGSPWRLDYSPANLSRIQRKLTDALRQRGYAEARVEISDLHANDTTGDVAIRLRVTEGPRWMVTAVLVEEGEQHVVADKIVQPYVGRPWSELLSHDLTTDVRNTCYRQGYPDATVQLVREPGLVDQGVQPQVLRLRVAPGPQVRIGEIRFPGAKLTKTSMLHARVGLQPGALLDPMVLEDARLDLTRLGCLDSVELTYAPAADGVRDPVFTVTETKPWESSLLFGYGTFDKLRVGVEVRHFNFLGLAGAGELKLVEATKSTRGDIDYTFPQFFSYRIDSMVEAYALRRDELQLVRRESGLRLAFTKPLEFLGAVATAGYLFEQLKYDQVTPELLGTEPASGNTTAASLEFYLSRDRRDNVLRPHQGYHWYLRTEFASPSLGGSSQYQQAELGISYHVALASGCWFHVGLTHGVVATFGANAGDLPVNKLFFPGGENSIRGYDQGEAAPRNPDGSYTGARSYVVLNVETEFALAKNWSLVLFSDSLGTATDLANYPFDEGLFSVGVGVRFQSIIGPIRLEYGHNLNPRPGDPSGTLLFSLGYPF